ncbi:MAG: tRNA pseudouridine(55) synthase TruB [Phototrophicaceae bacterium]
MTEHVFGFLNIDKPSGITSHDVVAKVRRLCRNSVGKTKVGHAGTLDPLATGVLVICLGYATRLSEYAMQSTKTYRATVHLGIETDTYDAEGEILAQIDASHITLEQVIAAFQPYIGDIQQMPPMYSAIKKDGKKLYELAREGIEIERPTRAVTIYDIQVVSWESPSIVLDVTCGSGTYIRSLAHDIGEQLAVGAHLSGLIRTKSGAFNVESACNLDTLLDDDSWREQIIMPIDALTDWTTIQLNDADVQEIKLGRTISKNDDLDDGFVMGYMSDGHLLAVLENRQTNWKPHKVFLPQS